MKDGAIKAVYDSDLVGLLRALDVYDEVIDGKSHCIYCKDVITIDNLDSIVPMCNQIVFTCNSPSCRFNLLTKEANDDCK